MGKGKPSTYAYSVGFGRGGRRGKISLGLSLLLPPEDLTVCVNTGDDESFHGLHVSPDLDTMMYTLSGLSNEETGWGIAGDTFTTLEMLGSLVWTPGLILATAISLPTFGGRSCWLKAKRFPRSLLH
ncbi:MAG: hypothetical protein CM1200mP22_28330 [Dehalococcoidia bacterium]|nr:MAG: hypothetical protein CM1200mP22_28330 [Dehalococcoidia bacterium]